MKLFNIIKFSVHIVLAAILFIFNEFFLDYVGYLVGGVMLLYGIEIVVNIILEKKKKKELFKEGLEAVLLVMFSVFMMVFGTQDFVKACLIWACWSIYREMSEIFLKVTESKKIIVGALNLAESLVAIVFSILLINTPTHHHALTHIILLGFELSFTVILPIIDNMKFKKEIK